MIPFQRHPDGVVSVKFGTHEAADEAIAKFNGRFFAGKEIICFSHTQSYYGTCLPKNMFI